MLREDLRRERLAAEECEREREQARPRGLPSGLVYEQKDWREELHPRDDHGRFASGGGSDGNGASSNADGGLSSSMTARGKYVGDFINAHGGLASKEFATDQVYDHVNGAQGAYTPEREALHQQIVDDYLKKYANVPSDKQALISGGLPGAGKTTSLTNPSLKDAVGVDTSHYAPVNADDFKEELASRGAFVQADSLSPMEHAAFLHEESSQLADSVGTALMSQGKNILYDITGNSESSFTARIASLDAAGYTTRGAFVDVTPDIAVQRAEARYSSGAENYAQGSGLGGRYVAPQLIQKQALPEGSDYSSKNRQSFENVKNTFSGGYVILDTSGPHAALVESKP